MRDAVGNETPRQRDRLGARLGLGRAVDHDPRQFDHLGDEAAVGFAFGFDG